MPIVARNQLKPLTAVVATLIYMWALNYHIDGAVFKKQTL
jgi:hypothetical protein